MNPAPVSGPGALSQRTDGGAIDGMQQPMQQQPMQQQPMQEQPVQEQMQPPMQQTFDQPMQ
jgi:hypothetical protein